MKTKLLKKIRRHYNWYLNQDGYPVLIDHLKKTATAIDIEYCLKWSGYSFEDAEKNVKVPFTEWAWRIMKTTAFAPYGYSMNNVWYRKAMRRSRIKNRTKISANEIRNQ